MADKFNVGDIVQLKSGGPKMTVEKIGAESYDRSQVYCTWFSGSKHAQNDFNPDTLVMAPEEKPKK